MNDVNMLDLIRRFDGPAPAVIDDESGVRLSYAELLRDAAGAGRELAGLQERALVFLLSTNTADFVRLYLGCLEAGLPLLLVDPTAPLEFLLSAYRPAMLLAPAGLEFPDYGDRGTLAVAPTYRVWQGPEPYPLHEDLAVLLPTSGSTGSPKLVRLKEANVRANAVSIAEYLELGPGERAIQSLPMYYSYGLSVLNSHLVSGGTLVLTTHSFIRPEFWAVFDREGCTSFAGIPFMYEMLHRLKFDPARHPSLRTLTQAGGGLGKAHILHFHELAANAGKRLVVMYGQTEATARISYVPPGRLAEKIGSIGIPIPGGKLTLRPVPGVEEGQEMVYEGPNVMMGYAECADDLRQGDVLKGVLPTGDLAVADEDGFFRLVGRLNRFAKLFGKRVSLDDVERSLEAEFKVSAAVKEGHDLLDVFLEAKGIDDPHAPCAFVAKRLGVPPKAVVVHLVDALPRTNNGKKNYSALQA